ncbi:MAG: choice-of-anchor D domain-containing protein [bacterium]|nr:choice-of-anchor D domain-containing protein [Candidatus Kapabacteria bacterium]
MTGDAMLAPDATGSITVRFKPQRNGSRRATIWMQTNDSSKTIDGVSERGAYYVDLHGWGRAGLDVQNVVLPPVLIGGTVGGKATLINSSTAAVDIRKITIVGPDAIQFRASTTKPWPALPTRVLPGSNLDLEVDFLPRGAPGLRRALIEVITTTNDTINVSIRGEAGTLELTVSPSSLFDDVSVLPGGYVRRTVSITNTGTFPIRLQKPRVVGLDSANYSLGALPRLLLSPGQTEYLEVTFRPLAQGVSSATLEILSNVATQTVALGGEALYANDGEVDRTDRVNDGDPIRNEVSGTGITGVDRGARIESIRPNPAASVAHLGFVLSASGEVIVTMHDAIGRKVADVSRGRFDEGRHSIRFDTGLLANGTYHVRIAIDGVTTSTTLTVAR